MRSLVSTVAGGRTSSRVHGSCVKAALARHYAGTSRWTSTKSGGLVTYLAQSRLRNSSTSSTELEAPSTHSEHRRHASSYRTSRPFAHTLRALYRAIRLGVEPAAYAEILVSYQQNAKAQQALDQRQGGRGGRSRLHRREAGTECSRRAQQESQDGTGEQRRGAR